MASIDVVEVITGLKGSTGISITNAELNSSGHLIITYSNNTTVDAGLTAFVDAVTYRDEAKAYSETAATQAANAATSSTSASASSTNSANSASSANTSATSANSSAISAEASAVSAESSKNASATNATNSSASATSASSSATSASKSSTQAASSATSAYNSATSASTSATNAKTSETNALNSANSSATSATDALTSANNASGYAQTASNAADTATQKSAAAATSEVNALNSATTAQTAATNAANVAKLYRQNATAYAVGDVVLGADGLSKSLRLVCKTAGTTANAAPTWTAVNTTVADGTTLVWEIKNAYDLMPIIAVSAAATIADYQLESCVALSGSTTYTVTLPAPTTSGHTLLVRNAGSVAMTLSTPSGTFVGPHGSLVSTFSILAGVIIGFLSNGTDWVIYRYEFNASTLAGYGITDAIANTGSTAISLAINSTDGGLDITVG